VGAPGVISLYLVGWLMSWMGAKLDRIIQLLEQIARELKVVPLPVRDQLTRTGTIQRAVRRFSRRLPG
jgi:hypothetical protein